MKNIKIARIVGFIFLIQFILGILINQVLIGPIVFSEDFLTNVFANSNKVIIGVLTSIINGVLGIIAAIILYPVFRKYRKGVALLFLSLTIIGFVILIIDNVFVLSLLSLSKEYTNTGISERTHFQTFGAVVYQTRWWTHYIEMFIACFPLFVFYFALFRTKLIPRFISLWGIASVILMCIAVMFAIFDQGTLMILFLPLALNQLVLFPWLIFKGFK